MSTGSGLSEHSTGSRHVLSHVPLEVPVIVGMHPVTRDACRTHEQQRLVQVGIGDDLHAMLAVT
jgi:hypothetical protein